MTANPLVSVLPCSGSFQEALTGFLRTEALPLAVQNSVGNRNIASSSAVGVLSSTPECLILHVEKLHVSGRSQEGVAKHLVLGNCLLGACLFHQH